jgi:hypothetical protein
MIVPKEYVFAAIIRKTIALDGGRLFSDETGLSLPAIRRWAQVGEGSDECLTTVAHPLIWHVTPSRPHPLLSLRVIRLAEEIIRQRAE